MELTDIRFADFDLPPNLQRGIADCGFVHLTPVQAMSLPETLKGKDLAVQAQTGSGKTAAFVVTIFDRFLKTKPPKTKGVCPRALVLTPTRELAVQVTNDALAIGRHLPFKSLAIYGGIDYRKQRDSLSEGVDLLIGTPGRLIDYLKQGVFHLKDLEVAVIDEADRMFDMGFIGDIRYLMRRMSLYDKRQSMLFSATLGYRVMELSYEYMNVASLIEVTPDRVTVDNAEQVMYHVGSQEKFSFLLGLLKTENWTKILLFVNTKREAQRLQEQLEGNGYPCAVLSGDVDQVRRLKIIRRFMKDEIKILVATDVASRGLHVEAISHVINYDLPQDAEDYVHRIGRTARAGAAGKAISLVCDRYVYSLEAIEKYIGQSIPVAWPEEGMFLKDVSPPRRDRRPAPKRHDSRRGPGKPPRRRS